MHSTGHTAYPMRCSSHKDISHHLNPVTESESRCFWGLSRQFKVITQEPDFLLSPLTLWTCGWSNLRSLPYVHKMAARHPCFWFYYHCSQVRKEGGIFISWGSSLSEETQRLFWIALSQTGHIDDTYIKERWQQIKREAVWWALGTIRREQECNSYLT